MLDLKSFIKALKLSWVRNISTTIIMENAWKLFFDFQLEDYGGVEFFTGNLSGKDVSKCINVPDHFITEIVQIWTEVRFEDTIKSIKHLYQNELSHLLYRCHKIYKKPENTIKTQFLP